MKTLIELTNRHHLSHSSVESWMGCGERYRLEKVLAVPQAPAWWFIGGSAFHRATEVLDLGQEENPHLAWTQAWEAEIAEAIPENTDYRAIRAGGRPTKEWPNKEDHEFWNHFGPQWVSDYMSWRVMASASGWQLLDLDGAPAVEVPFTVEFGDVLVKGYIDRLFVNSNGEVIVVDLKTGKVTPASTQQLGVYRVGIEKTVGLTANIGAYYMARKGQLSEQFALMHYTEDSLGYYFAKAKVGIENEIFLPHVTSMCGTCGVQEFCYARGGNPPALPF